MATRSLFSLAQARSLFSLEIQKFGVQKNKKPRVFALILRFKEKRRYDLTLRLPAHAPAVHTASSQHGKSRDEQQDVPSYSCLIKSYTGAKLGTSRPYSHTHTHYTHTVIYAHASCAHPVLLAHHPSRPSRPSRAEVEPSDNNDEKPRQSARMAKPSSITMAWSAPSAFSAKRLL